VTGYVIVWGTASGDYTNTEDAGAQTAITISNLSAGTTYYFAAAAYDAAGDEGPYSTEISYVVPVVASLSFSGLTQTYDGAPETVTVTTSPADLPVTVTYNGSTNPPVNAGAYAVVATVADTNYTGSATNTLVISPASATVTLGGLAVIYNGSAQPATVTTSPAGLATTTTYNGLAAAPVNAGSYLVLATVSNPNYTGGASNILVISPPTYTVTTQVFPAGEGSATGAGSYVAGSTVALTASAKRGYIFTNWTLNGAVQSTSSNYSFVIATNLTLVANFTTNPPVPIALLNGSFESPAVAGGDAGGLPEGWLPANEDLCGVYNPGAGVYANEVNDILPSPADGSQVLFIVGGNYVAQFLTNTLRAGHTYTLSGAIGNRGDGYGILSSDQDYVDLVAGNTIVAENFSLPHPAPGAFLPWTISYTAPASGFPTGPLQIRLGQNGAGQVNYDNITLTVARLVGTTLTPSATALASSQNPAQAGAVVAFAATVTGSNGMPTGTVAFFDGTNNLGSGTLDSSGVASLSNSTLSAGASPHSITAAYGGDGVFAASTSSVLSQIITNAAGAGSQTTITLDNDNFAIPAGAQGTVEGVPPGWLAANKDPYGVYNPAPGVYSNEVNDILPAPVGSSQLLYIIGGNYVAQFLTNTLQAGQTYTLSGAIGNRGDGYGMQPADQAYVSLLAGSTILAQNAGLTHPAPGTFLAWTISYTAPATGFPTGGLQIQLGQNGSGEVDFGNITLTMTSPGLTSGVMAEDPSATNDAPVESATSSAADSTNVNNLAVPAAGTYRGLFYVTGDAAEDSSGAITATITGTGAFSATLQLGAQSCPFSGSLSPAGAALNSITPTNSNPLTVQLQLDLTNGPLTGTVSDGTWTATLLAEAAIYSNTNPAPQAGNYTLLLPSAEDASVQAGGNGSGTVAVSDSGDVTFLGILGDGTPVTCTGTVCSQGLWPFYLPLSGGNSCILGWLSFTNTASGYVLAPTASGIALLPSAQ
jgi:hypothetical protein